MYEAGSIFGALILMCDPSRAPITLGKPLNFENLSMVQVTASPFGQQINLGARQCKAYVIRLTALNAVAFPTPN